MDNIVANHAFVGGHTYKPVEMCDYDIKSTTILKAFFIHPVIFLTIQNGFYPSKFSGNQQKQVVNIVTNIHKKSYQTQ